MKEETKTRLLIIPIVAMLAVTIHISGCLEKQDIEVEEGYGEMEIDYLGDEGVTAPINKSVNATTIVEENSELEFEVTVADMTSLESAELTQVDVFVEVAGKFEEEPSLESLKFTARTLPNMNAVDEVNNSIGQEFRDTDTVIDNGSCWPITEQKNSARGDETAFIGFDLDDNDFKTGSKLVWRIPFENEEPYTLELSATVEGIAEDVGASIDVHIEEGDEGEDNQESFTEFTLFGESGKEADYPTNLTVDETGTVMLEVTNNEGTKVNYSLVIGLGYSYENMISEGKIPKDFNFTLPSNNTYKETGLTLEDGEKWNRTVNFSIGEAGKEYMLQFFLLRDGDVYRQLHLWTDVWEE